MEIKKGERKDCARKTFFFSSGERLRYSTLSQGVMNLIDARNKAYTHARTRAHPRRVRSARITSENKEKLCYIYTYTLAIGGNNCGITRKRVHVYVYIYIYNATTPKDNELDSPLSWSARARSGDVTRRASALTGGSGARTRALG